MTNNITLNGQPTLDDLVAHLQNLQAKGHGQRIVRINELGSRSSPCPRNIFVQGDTQILIQG